MILTKTWIMKKAVLLAFLFLLCFSFLTVAQTLKPYTLGAISGKSLEETAEILKSVVEVNGFQVLGEYSPASDKDRYLVVFSSEEMLAASAELGRLSGFGAALRVALTFETGRVVISYTNPEYWLNAYYQDDYEKVSSELSSISARLIKVMQNCGDYSGKGFGSEEGLDIDKLRSYRYMVGMQKFHNTVVLAEFETHQEAIDRVESSILKGVTDVKKVYSIEIPGTEMKLYGFALGGEKGESHFMPIIDIGNPKHTAFLPYEFLVSGNKVHMLHGRFRIALSFPDLTMGTFTKIMSSPGDIKDLLQSVVK